MILDSKSNRALALAATLLLVSAVGCSDSYDGDSNQNENVVLQHDDDNLTAPNLSGDTYEAAVRFTASDLNGVEDGQLIKVKFFIAAVPDSVEVKVYGDSGGNTPGPLLYSADVTASVDANDWNTHALNDSVEIPNSGDLWIGIKFTHAGFLQAIGCDPGPAVTDGDWLWTATDSTWTPYNARPLGADINWNIRGVVQVPY